nr:protein transport protein [Tanacetum cinerariifolium]
MGPLSFFPKSSPSNLLSFLSAFVTSDHFHVITPPNNHPNNHNLLIKHSPSVHVSLSSPSLTSSLTNKIKSEIATTTVPLRSNLVLISYKHIDDVIKNDYEKSHEEGVYVYLLNLGQMDKRYGCKYGESGGEASLGFTKCTGMIWTGEKRYLCIDLSAGPVDYGPALFGDGMLPRGEFHPLSGLHYGVKLQKSVLADVASLVWSAYKVLLVPSLRVSILFENELVVQFVHVRGGDKDVRGLDFGVVERNLVRDGLLFSDQVVKFKTYEVDLAKCVICSFVISLSTTSYMSRYLFDNYTLIVSEYLDSKCMHQTLSEAQDEIRRYHQSVAFKDMVIATRELERPLVGSILQSMWGVSPTHLKDAAKRNVILTSLKFTITSALDVLKSVSAHGRERKLLPHNQLSEFIQRWNLFKYKLDKVVSSLSHLDFETALYYLRSSDHDLYVIHSLVYHASQDLEVSLVCFEDLPFPWATFFMSIGIFFVHVIETTNEETKILATVDGKPKTISESLLRRHLRLNDEEGISSLLNTELFENLSLMGYNI